MLASEWAHIQAVSAAHKLSLILKGIYQLPFSDLEDYMLIVNANYFSNTCLLSLMYVIIVSKPS